MSLTETRTDLYTALNTALTDPRVRVAKYPPRPGNYDRYDALVTIAELGKSDEGAGMVTAMLDVQVGIGDIDKAFALMDEVLDDVDAAIPIQWETANWVTDVDQDDQPVIRAVTELLGHPSEAAPVVTGEERIINDSGDLRVINAAGDTRTIN